MKRAFLYIRVSTDEQADKGYSQRYQEERLMKYCELQDIKVMGVFKEDHSAKSFDRPEFQKLLTILKKKIGEVDLLLFIKWDRFSRNAGDAYSMINQLNRLGVEPQAIEQPLDLNIPENKIMLAFYLSAPEVENDRRALNVTTGMRRAKKEGRWMATAPKGYKNVIDELGKKSIVPSADAKHIKFIFEQIAEGTYTVVEVWKMALKRGFKYSKSNLFVLLRNPVYCRRIRIEAFKDEPAITVKGQHQPIISEELFYQVQDILDGRKRIVPVKNTRREELPLRGYLICPRCGRILTGSASKGTGGRYFYYHCQPGCKERVRADVANAEMQKMLDEFSSNRQAVDLYGDIMAQVIKQNQTTSSRKGKSIKEEIEKLRQRLMKAQHLLLDGEMRMDEYRTFKSQTENEIDRLEREYLQTGMRDTDHTRYIAFGRDLLQNLSYYYENGSVTIKQGIVGSIFPEKLVFEGGRYRTPKLINAIRYICQATSGLRPSIKQNEINFYSHSFRVAPGRIELLWLSFARVNHVTYLKSCVTRFAFRPLTFAS